MSNTIRHVIVITLCSTLLASCQSSDKGTELAAGLKTSEILLTSEAGAKIAPQENVSLQTGTASGTRIVVRPDVVKQTISGIGSSFTESSAFVLAHLDREKRHDVMNKVFSEDGANFSLTRTPIGATDFAVTGKYSYAEVADDELLEHFSIEPDHDGFDATEYPGIKDESFDLRPMIKEALAIKEAQDDKDLQIIASAWTGVARR